MNTLNSFFKQQNMQYKPMMQLFSYAYQIYLLRIIQLQVIDNINKVENIKKIKTEKYYYDVTSNILITKGITNGAMSAAFRVAFNESVNLSKGKKFKTESEGIEAAHESVEWVRGENVSKRGKYSGLSSVANAAYVYHNEGDGSFETSGVVGLKLKGLNWYVPGAGHGNRVTTYQSVLGSWWSKGGPPHIEPWIGDDKMIVAMVVTQAYNRQEDNNSGLFQRYANEIGTVVVYTENSFNRGNPNYKLTKETFKAR